MDKITQHETELKKKFSEKVYNFLKELKNRNLTDHFSKERRNQFDSPKDNKHNNEIDFRNRLQDERKKTLGLRSESNTNFLESGSRHSPIKHKIDQELLLQSMQNKSPKAESRRDPNEEGK